MTYPYQYYMIFITDKEEYFACDDEKTFFDKDIDENTVIRYIYTEEILMTDGIGQEVIGDNLKFMIFTKKRPGTIEPPFIQKQQHKDMDITVLREFPKGLDYLALADSAAARSKGLEFSGRYNSNSRSSSFPAHASSTGQY